MSYFADLSPHTYTPTGGQTVLNIGWLDAAFPYQRGEAPPDFLRELKRLCERPILLHRGFHVCQFCPPQQDTRNFARRGNGQNRVEGQGGICYSAPTMVHHYVAAHAYLPPSEFIAAILATTS